MSELVIRPALPGDAESIRAIYAPSILHSSVSFEMEVPSIEEMARRMGAVSAEVPWLVAEMGGQVIGYAYAGPFRARSAYRWTRESSVYIAESHHRQGVARALMQALIGVCRALGYRMLVAGATLPNAGSESLHLALGFQSVGEFPSVGRKAGAWHDVAFWILDLWGPGDHRDAGAREPEQALDPAVLGRILADAMGNGRP